MPIRVWDYRVELANEREEVFAAIAKVLDSGRLILGPSVAAFESAFASFCGVDHGVGVNSGTDALFLALMALDIGAGDEVVTVANTAIPTVSAIVATGATPRFVDVHPRTYLMDVAALESAITPRTRCILPVHLYGQCADMTSINELAARHGLKVVEDCAQCHGASQDGRPAGSMSNASAWSFYPTKNLGAFGDAGLIATRDAPLAARLRRLRMYGTEGTYDSIEQGYNSRLDELQAELLLRKLARLEGYVARRRELALRYDRMLARSASSLGLSLPETVAGNAHAYHLYVAAHPSRTRIIERLAQHEISVNINYPWPIHTMRAYRYLGGKDGDLPVTEAAAKRVFSLPLYPGLTDAEQDTVCEALNHILAHEL